MGGYGWECEIFLHGWIFLAQNVKMQSRLFSLTRWRLAFWYAGVMGIILGLCGLGVYQAITHAHWVALDRELESVAGTLHDSIELKLKQPGRLEPVVSQLLPNICLVESSCTKQQLSSKRHVLSAISQGNYYVRLFDNSGRLIAVAGDYPKGLSPAFKQELWQILFDRQGYHYHQISLSLHTQNNLSWGYIQVGRSLKDLDDYTASLKLILGLGLPLAMGLVAVSSWWLAGLAMQPISQSYNQIQQFTADAAHELRTPVAASSTTVESALLTPYLSDSEAREILQSIDRQNQRLTQLVNDLLLLARMERRALPVRHQDSCLNDIVTDLVEELETLAIASGVTLRSDIRVDKALHIVGNEEQLYRLVSNLIVNAIQYTPQGGQVSVILDCIDNYALIHVKDTGTGIAPPEQKRIFDRFYRVNSDRSRISGGSGLGLAIAMAITQAHNGSLQVQSELGKGSTFTIRLPY